MLDDGEFDSVEGDGVETTPGASDVELLGNGESSVSADDATSEVAQSGAPSAAVAGIVVGIICALVAVILVAIAVVRNRKARQIELQWDGDSVSESTSTITSL